MQKYITRNIATGVLALASLAVAPMASAQNLQSGYFDDNYLYRYQANPAIGNERGFVSMPGLGNFIVGTNGSIGLSDIFYNVNGRTTTLLNPGVSSAEALGNFADHSRLGLDTRVNILTIGFGGFGGYNSISLSARAAANIGLPKDIVRMAKDGLTNDSYDFSNLGANARGWAELAINHSQEITRKLRVGATVKFLVGLAAFDAHVNTANLHLYEDNYIGQVDAEITSNIKGMHWEQSYDHNTDRYYVDGLDGDFSAPNGFGVAFDLGAVYTLNQDWEFSAAVTDLGFTSWSESQVASTNGLREVETNSFSFNVDNSTSFDDFRDRLANLYELEDVGNTGGRTTGIGATMTLGAKYTFPLYRKLHFGLMNTTRINGDFSWTDFRLSANVRPVKFVSAGINLGVGTFGASFGWILDFKCPGFNLFLASDCIPGKLAKQYVPLNSNMNLNFGLNFPF